MDESISRRDGCFTGIMVCGILILVLCSIVEIETGFFRWFYHEFGASWLEYQQMFNEWFGLASVLLSQFT